MEIERRRRDYFLARLKMIEDLLPVSRNERRLFEIGCGGGFLLAIASERGWVTEGIELSSELAEKARLNSPKSRIHLGDFLQMEGLAEGTFDAVVGLDVIEHVLSPSELIGRARRLLRPGGILLLQTPNADSLRSRLHKSGWNMLLPEYHFHLFSVKGLSGLIESSGLEIVRLSSVSGTGLERGILECALRIREEVLSWFRLGNALIVIAGKHGAGTSLPR